jgi:hypothetical protein
LENLATLQRLELLLKFPAKTEKIQKIHKNLHGSSFCVSPLIQFYQFSSIQGFPATLKFLHNEKLQKKNTKKPLIEHSPQNPPPHWQPEKEKKTDQRSSTEI